MQANDKRRSNRFKLNRWARFNTKDKSILCHIKNISTSGVLLETNDWIDILTVGELVFEVNDSEKISTLVRVVRNHENGKMNIGFGVEFVDLDTSYQQILSQIEETLNS